MTPYSNSNQIFRLVALKTGNGLNEQGKLISDQYQEITKRNYLKLLEPNTIFPFFQCYQIDGNTLVYDKTKDLSKLYNLDQSVDVNIDVSAIVGRNGSGKSTLLEIIYQAIFNLSIAKEILLDSNKKKLDMYQDYLECTIYYQIAKEEYVKIEFTFNDKKQGCSIFKSVKHDKTKFVFSNEVEVGNFDLKELFYNIVVNYSIYGLNDKRIGDWINNLFHKNDSYQVPIVINPMRKQGNFDINAEEHFTRERLIANAVIKINKTEEKNWVTENQYLNELSFRINKTKVEYLEKSESIDTNTNEKLTRTIEELIEQSNIGTVETVVADALKIILYQSDTEYGNIKYAKDVELYIVKKLYRIAFTYKKYHKFLDNRSNSIPIVFISLLEPSLMSAYLEELARDKSHVTTKLRQALNYLLNDPLKETETETWKLDSGSLEVFSIAFNRFAIRLNGYSGTPINYLPPSLFRVQINIVNDKTKEESQLEDLSSGELQLVNSVQSSLYHLNNLDSYKDEDENTYKIKHRNALLIFDEIELYFHPEFQRKMVKYLLEHIDRLDLQLVKNIHILFVTHSPFILSDIPRTNLLKLEEGKPVIDDEPTFAANIYEMLKSSFFMNAGTGDYSIQKINEKLDIFNHILSLKRGLEEEKKKLENLAFDRSAEALRKERLIVSKEEELNTAISQLEKSNVTELLGAIGDGLIKKKMYQLYDACVETPDKVKKDRLEREIERLNNELNDLS
ncbi:MAG: putative ATP-binding protein involved in virulence [Roseivirga sp.]|jgi:predicted ATP-binding protein involved in virulence